MHGSRCSSPNPLPCIPASSPGHLELREARGGGAREGNRRLRAALGAEAAEKMLLVGPCLSFPRGKPTPCQLLCVSQLPGMGKDSVIQKKEFLLFCGDLEVKVVRCRENK